MKTVLISGSAPAPAALRDIVERGSTTFSERRGDQAERMPAPDVDRVVFWSAAEDVGLHELAERYAKVEARERRTRIVFVADAATGSEPPQGLPPDEVFVWPRDEDRLKMAFLTGA